MLGSLIAVPTVFVTAGVVTTLTGAAAIFVLRSATQLASRRIATGET